MTDIVARLRQTAGGALGPHHPSLLELEAADEIERQRQPFRLVQLIDFAPKDGTRILGHDWRGWREMWWKEDLYEGAFWQDHFDSEPGPTIWLPLPAEQTV